MIQIYHTPPESQVKDKKNPNKWGERDSWWVKPSPVWGFRHKPYKFVRDNLSESATRVLNVLIAFTKSYKHIYVSQERLACMSGCTRQTVNRVLKILGKAGLVRTSYRFFKTCYYKLTDLFRLKRVRLQLRYLLPALFLSCLSEYVTLSRESTYSLLYLDIKDRSLSYSNEDYVCNSKWPEYFPSHSNPREFSLSKILFKRNKRSAPMAYDSKYVREAIEAITEIKLTSLGKAKLAVFPARAIKQAHYRLKELLKADKIHTTPFSILMTKCKDLCPTVDTSHNNPLFKALQNKLGFNTKDAPVMSKHIVIPKRENKNSYRTEECPLASRARTIQAKYEHLNSRRGYSVTPKPDRSKQEASFPISVICDKCEENWNSTIKKLGPRHPVLNKELAIKCMLGTILKHCDIRREKGTEQAIEYIKSIMFHDQAPKSIQRETLINETEYYAFLDGIINDYGAR